MFYFKEIVKKKKNLYFIFNSFLKQFFENASSECFLLGEANTKVYKRNIENKLS